MKLVLVKIEKLARTNGGYKKDLVSKVVQPKIAIREDEYIRNKDHWKKSGLLYSLLPPKAQKEFQEQMGVSDKKNVQKVNE